MMLISSRVPRNNKISCFHRTTNSRLMAVFTRAGLQFKMESMRKTRMDRAFRTIWTSTVKESKMIKKEAMAKVMKVSLFT